MLLSHLHTHKNTHTVCIQPAELSNIVIHERSPESPFAMDEHEHLAAFDEDDSVGWMAMVENCYPFVESLMFFLVGFRSFCSCVCKICVLLDCGGTNVLVAPHNKKKPICIMHIFGIWICTNRTYFARVFRCDWYPKIGVFIHRCRGGCVGVCGCLNIQMRIPISRSCVVHSVCADNTFN